MISRQCYFCFSFKTVSIAQFFPVKWIQISTMLLYEVTRYKSGNLRNSCNCNKKALLRAPVSKKYALILRSAQRQQDGVFLTVHINSRCFVARPSHVTCHAGIITAILQPNSFKVEASVTANVDVGIGNQLPKERCNVLLKKILVDNIYFGMPVALLGCFTF